MLRLAKRLAIPLLCLLLGLLLRPVAVDPDSEFTREHWVGSFLLFLFWLQCLLAWGRVFTQTLKLQEYGWMMHLALGTVFGILSIEAFIALGWARWDTQLLGLLTLMVGLIIDSAFSWDLVRAFKTGLPRPKDPWEWVGLWALILIFVLRVVAASILKYHSDVYMYHLGAPRLWIQHGGYYLPASFNVALYARCWEDLYAWGQWLLGDVEAKGAIEGHFFAQWCHTVIGFGGSLLALIRLFSGTRSSLNWVLFAVMLSSLCESYFPYSYVAKNDWGGAFFCLCGMAMLFQGVPIKSTVKELTIAGVFFGTAIAVKFNFGLSFLATLIFWALFVAEGKWTHRVLKIAILGGASLIASSPCFVRNLWLAGDPTFPFPFLGLFNPNLSFSNYVEHQANTRLWVTRIEDLWARAIWLIQDYLFWQLVFLLPIPIFLRTIPKKIALLWALSLTTLAPFVFTVSRYEFKRWFGIALILNPALVTLSLASALDRVANPWRIYLDRLPIALMVICVFFQNQGFSDVRSTLIFAPPNQVIRLPSVYPGADSKTWLRFNAKASDKILSTGDNQLYLILHLNVDNANMNPVLDHTLNTHPKLSVPSKLSFCKKLGYRYILDTQQWDNPTSSTFSYKWSYFSAHLDQYLQTHADLIVYQGQFSRVIDLNRFNL